MSRFNKTPNMVHLTLTQGEIVTISMGKQALQRYFSKDAKENGDGDETAAVYYYFKDLIIKKAFAPIFDALEIAKPVMFANSDDPIMAEKIKFPIEISVSDLLVVLYGIIEFKVETPNSSWIHKQIEGIGYKSIYKQIISKLNQQKRYMKDKRRVAFTKFSNHKLYEIKTYFTSDSDFELIKYCISRTKETGDFTFFEIDEIQESLNQMRKESKNLENTEVVFFKFLGSSQEGYPEIEFKEPDEGSKSLDKILGLEKEGI